MSAEDSKPAAVPIKDERDLAIRDLTCEQLILTCGSVRSTTELQRRATLIDLATGKHRYPKSNEWYQAQRQKIRDGHPSTLSANGPKFGTSTDDAIALSSDEATVADLGEDDDTNSKANPVDANEEEERARLHHTPPRMDDHIPETKRTREGEETSPSDSTGTNPPACSTKASEMEFPEAGVAQFLDVRPCRAAATYCCARCKGERHYSTDYRSLLLGHPHSNRRNNSEWIGQLNIKMCRFRTAFIGKAQEFTIDHGGLSWDFTLPKNVLIPTQSLQCYQVGLEATIGKSRHPCYDAFIYRTIIWFVDFCNRYHGGVTGVMILHILNEADEVRNKWLTFEGRVTKPQPDALKVRYYILPDEGTSGSSDDGASEES